MRLQVIVHQAEEGGYWAEVPALPGCVSEGDTWEELLHNIQEAVEGWLLASTEMHQPSDNTASVKAIEITV